MWFTSSLIRLSHLICWKCVCSLTTFHENWTRQKRIRNNKRRRNSNGRAKKEFYKKKRRIFWKGRRILTNSRNSLYPRWIVIGCWRQRKYKSCWFMLFHGYMPHSTDHIITSSCCSCTTSNRENIHIFHFAFNFDSIRDFVFVNAYIVVYLRQNNTCHHKFDIFIENPNQNKCNRFHEFVFSSIQLLTLREWNIRGIHLLALLQPHFFGYFWSRCHSKW